MQALGLLGRLSGIGFGWIFSKKNTIPPALVPGYFHTHHKSGITFLPELGFQRPGMIQLLEGTDLYQIGF